MYFSLPASIRLGYALQASSPFCWLPKSSGIIYMYRRLALSLLLRCGTLCCVCECKGITKSDLITMSLNISLLQLVIIYHLCLLSVS